MQSELKSLSKIFNEIILRIPDYQRGYSWQEKQLKDFWTDIEQLDVASGHYTGVLTFEPVISNIYREWRDDIWIIESRRYEPLYVVDGQQRITTAIILIQSIIESVKENETINYSTALEIRKKYIFESKDGGISKSYIFGYEKDNPSYEFLKQEIFNETSENHNTFEETIYTSNLKFAKSFFKEKLAAISKEKIEEIYTKTTQRLLFNIFHIEPELDVFVTFETMNNRGKPLSHLELLKNRLIYISTKFKGDGFEKESLRKTINEAWKTIYHYLGKSRNMALEDDLFLASHFLLYFGPKLSAKIEEESEILMEYNIFRHMRRDTFKDYLLDNIFNPKRINEEENPLSIQEIHSYAIDIKNTVVEYYKIIKPENSTDTEKTRIQLERINRLSNQNAILFCLALSKLKIKSSIKEKILFSLERFTFLEKFKPYKFSEVRINKIAIGMISGKDKPEDILETLDAECERFSKSSDFNESIQKIGKEIGYYRWSPLRYFMFEYEQYIKNNNKSTREKLRWEEFSNEDYENEFKTIEHIYPQTGTSSYWRERFNKYSVKERNIIKNSIGNLLPLSKAKNSSLGNRSFEEKKINKTKDVGYKFGCYSEIEVSMKDEWTQKEVLDRGILLLEFMEERWNINIGGREEKIKILGLDFIK